MKKEKKLTARKKGHFFLRGFLKIFIRKPKFIYLDGEPVKDGSIILSNHVGKKAPLALDLYFQPKFRFWGAHEMNEGLGSVYKYQTEVFYHQKQHWPLFLARLFCIIASPLTYLYYRGLNLISTYPDHRFRKTIRESIKTLENDMSLVIFPEDSSKGYFDVMTSFHAGFLTLGKSCLKKGLDVPIYVSYYIKKKKTYVFDKPIMFSELIANGYDKEKISADLCRRTNELKDLDLESLQNLNKTKTKNS